MGLIALKQAVLRTAPNPLLKIKPKSKRHQFEFPTSFSKNTNHLYLHPTIVPQYKSASKTRLIGPLSDLK